MQCSKTVTTAGIQRRQTPISVVWTLRTVRHRVCQIKGGVVWHAKCKESLKARLSDTSCHHGGDSGTKGGAAEACVHAVNPLCPGRQAAVNAALVFRVSQYHFARQQRPTFGAHYTGRQDFKRKFSTTKIPAVTARTPLIRGAGCPMSHHPARLSAIRDPDHRAPIEVMVTAHLCPGKERNSWLSYWRPTGLLTV